MTQEEMDDAIDEALADAVCDGEGRIIVSHVKHHLAKHGLEIVAHPTEAERQRDEAVALLREACPEVGGFRVTGHYLNGNLVKQVVHDLRDRIWAFLAKPRP